MKTAPWRLFKITFSKLKLGISKPQNVILPVVTVTGYGVDPRKTVLRQYFHCYIMSLLGDVLNIQHVANLLVIEYGKW